MNYVAGLVALGIVVVLYILYRVTQKAFNVVFGIMCVHAYLLLVDRVYPDISLLRIVYSPPACSNQTSPPPIPITLESPITLAEITETINQQVPPAWTSWMPSFLRTPSITEDSVSDTTPQYQESVSMSKPSPKPKPKAKDKDKEEFEEFQRWKASRSKSSEL